MDPLTRNVFLRYAYEFPSEGALRKYLRDHPGADPKKHTVVDKKPKPSLKDKLKGLSQGAKSFLAKAPKQVKQFFQDPDYRRESLQKLHAAMEGAPKKYGKKLIETAKHEVHEFKVAGGAVKDALKGKKLSDEQKHAVKTVAIHMGVTLAAAAFSTTGVLAGAAFAGKATAQHIALKAAARVLGQMHVMGEAGVVGEGLLSLMSKIGAKDKQDPEKILSALVIQAVQEELKALEGDEAASELLEAMGKEGSKKEASWKVEAKGVSELLPLIEQALALQKRFRSWVRDFPAVLRKAEQGAVGLEGTGMVWQDEFGPYWAKTDSMWEVLADIDYDLDGIWIKSKRTSLEILVNMVRDATHEGLMPKKARIIYAFGDPKFMSHPRGRDHIAYEISRLKEWAAAFEKWNDQSIQILMKSIPKARRLV